MAQLKYATADLNVLFTDLKYGHIPHNKCHVPNTTASLITHGVHRMTKYGFFVQRHLLVSITANYTIEGNHVALVSERYLG